jgi:hypothetical protein
LDPVCLKFSSDLGSCLIACCVVVLSVDTSINPGTNRFRWLTWYLSEFCMLHWLRRSSLDTINDMEDYAMTPTGDNQREDLPSPSIMERDQFGSSFLETRDVSANGASTSYLFAQDQGLGIFGEISISSLFNLPIVRDFDPALHTLLREAKSRDQARDQARDSLLNADAPVWEMARTSTLELMNGASSSTSPI